MSYDPITCVNDTDLYNITLKNKTASYLEDILVYKWNTFETGEIVDYVLAYNVKHAEHEVKREEFEANLQEVGLKLEKCDSQIIHFTKIHVPKDVLRQYAELLKLRLPIKESTDHNIKNGWLSSKVDHLVKWCGIKPNPDYFPPEEYHLTCEYSRDKDYLFESDKDDFFKQSARIAVVHYILEREKYGPDHHDKGIKRLLAEGVYKAAYPLHDGDLNYSNCKRKLLLHHWASVSQFLKYQPIDDIKDYFGIKFALYFTWLGFYTNMLIPASVIGIVCLIYAATTLNSDTISRDICQTDVLMCPRCDKYCDYWKLNETCTYAKIQHFIDNPATIFFAVFMSIWATMYLEMWKRYSADIAHRWGLTGFDLQAEPPRPEYFIRLAKTEKTKINAATLLPEPAVSFWKVKLPSVILSFTIVFIWALVSVGVVFGVVIYRMAQMGSEAIYSDHTTHRIYIIPITAAIINLVCIQILNRIYDRLAHILTESELPRTQTEYEDSLALKMYIFQFVNYYSSIFYIAFLKGKFVGYPAKYNKVLGYRQEECNPGGCLMELTIQLAIIMVGNQTMNALMEILIPLGMKMYKHFKITTGIEKSSDETGQNIVVCNQWTEDYKLSDFNENSLFSEYLEMVLQYGFVTIFVTAFPLAPLFALINNVFEMRLDAKKFVKYFKRPVPTRVKDIGVWYTIMTAIGRISVVSNAFIIAFSSHCIPMLVYTMKINPKHTSEGFLDHSLAYFNTANFTPNTAPIESAYGNVSICRYAEYRNPPDDEKPYKRPLIYWHILAARLAFVVAYQNLVNFVIMVVEWAIPDIPKRLNDRVKREAYKINEAIIKHEAEKGRSLRRRKKESMRSVASLYFDANGDANPGSKRNSQYQDIVNT